MSSPEEVQVRRWVNDEIGEVTRQMQCWTDSRRDMFHGALLALVALGALSFAAFRVHVHKSSIEECAAACGPGRMATFTKGYEVYRPLNSNDKVPPSCVCLEAKQP